MDPSRDAFRRHWEQLNASRVVFGTFPAGDRTIAFFDERADDGPSLYVSAAACSSDRQVLNLGWHIVGQGHQASFELFAQDLEAGRVQEFFSARGVRDAEWDELDAAIGVSHDRLRQRLRPIACVGWLRRNDGSAVSNFEREWNGVPLNPDAIATWFGVERSTASSLLVEVRHAFGDEAQPPLLKLLGFDVEEWQKARQKLGLAPFVFSATIESFRRVSHSLFAVVAVATSRYVSVSEMVALKSAEAIRDSACPNAIAETPANDAAVLRASLMNAAEILDAEKGHAKGLGLLARTLRRDASRDRNSWVELRVRGVPRRELQRVVDFDEEQRAEQASTAVSAVLKVASALSANQGERFSVDEHDQRITKFTRGWRANPFAGVRTIRRILVRQALKTTRLLEKQGAFREPMPWTELWARYSELGPAHRAPGSDAKPPPKIKVLGQEIDAGDVATDLALGSAGVLGAQLAANASPSLDLAAPAALDRNPAPDAPEHGKKRKRGSRGGGGGAAYEDNPLVGLLGESFIYEQFQVGDYPDFSPACWVSENRGKYLGGRAEAEESGYDFKYRDIKGTLTGRSGAPLCLIEVKASSGDGSQPFPMTLREWETAQDCHGSADTVYIVIRVRNVLQRPEIHDVIIDPVMHYEKGTLRVDNKDLTVRVGELDLP